MFVEDPEPLGGCATVVTRKLQESVPCTEENCHFLDPSPPHSTRLTLWLSAWKDLSHLFKVLGRVFFKTLVGRELT